jgi:hypothetical protein
MNDNQDIKKELFTKSNLIIVIGTYLLASVLGSIGIFDENNLVAPDLIQKIIILLVVLLVVAPFASIFALLTRLRYLHCLKTKDFSGFFFIPKEGAGNPDISSLFGLKGQKILNIFLKVLLALLIVVFFIFLPLKYFF